MSTTETVALYDTIRNAIDTERPVVALYATGGTEPKARVIWPQRLFATKDGHDCLRGHDSLRDEVRTFRLDRFLPGTHVLEA